MCDGVSENLQKKKPARNQLILIGGCSRSGKSTIAKLIHAELGLRGISSVIVSADHWLLPASQRRESSKVLDRYRIEELYGSITAMLRGECAQVFAYDEKTREFTGQHLNIVPPKKPFVILAEGVATLAISRLRRLSKFNLFVHENDSIRVKRLIRFYRDYKGLNRESYKSLIKEREFEEVPFIKSTEKYAHLTIVK
jgi:uridine kinase